MLMGPPSAETISFEAALAAFGALFAACLVERPRGGTARQDLMVVKDSPVHGRGVFASQVIPAGTVLGIYPGRVRTPNAMLEKAQAAPQSKSYAWSLEIPAKEPGAPAGQLFLDPTGADGHPDRFPTPGLPWLPIDVTLAYINEPPGGLVGPTAGCNIHVEENPDTLEVTFEAMRDIMPGEELYIDYGPQYDRSEYDSVALEEDAMEHEKAMAEHDRRVGVNGAGGRLQGAVVRR
ncbi:unnamed protein product [Pedinophyceae sp. YPF-701]|nr:unnamed protein product [Pedinophyceae sp. YPF-701]